MPEEKDDDAKVVPFPLPQTPAPSNPEPPCTCGNPPNVALCVKHGG